MLPGAVSRVYPRRRCGAPPRTLGAAPASGGPRSRDRGYAAAAGGTVTAYDEATGEMTLEVFVKNARDEVLTPGVITVRLTAAS